jgi:beta-phosphoglucomutase
MTPSIRACIFDLDGVITDTAEYHYRAWQALADKYGFAFNRQVNEQLRGVSRQRSLEIILGGREVAPEQFQAMMDWKNEHYVQMLDEITPKDLLPGARELLQALRAAGIKVALGSASKNARAVVERLGIGEMFDAIADGHSVTNTKPAPDLFLHAAAELGVAPAACVVFEDAEAGIDAALAAGMWAVGLGPAERVGHAHARLDSLQGVNWQQVQQALANAPGGLEQGWVVVEESFNPATLHHKETVFVSGNGYVNLRGAFEEGYPGSNEAAFIHRLWDDVPVVFTELVNIPRWWYMRISVNGQRFRLDRGQIEGYRRTLNLRDGTIRREVRWRAPDGTLLDFQFERMTNLAAIHQAAVRVRVTVAEGRAALRIDAGLDGHVDNLGLRHWTVEGQGEAEDRVWLQVRTRATKIDLVLCAALAVEGMAERRVNDADGQPTVRHDFGTLTAGQCVAVTSYVGLVTSQESQTPVETAQQEADSARGTGFETLLTNNALAWAAEWATTDVLVEGDDEAQLALRYNIFQLLIAAPRHTERASIGAKTMSGYGYRGHVFWDTEIFILPLFSYTRPEIARNLLMYRYHNLVGARAKAGGNRFEGAQFPWESAATGKEVTPTWVPHFADPTQLVRIWTGDIEIHITADIAYATIQYWRVSGDDEWMRNYGAEMVLDGAVFWGSRAELEEDGCYHFRDVIGPDEYHDHVDDNVFTNRMAQWHLQQAFHLLAWLQEAAPEKARDLTQQLRLTPERLDHWRDVIKRVYIAENPETGLMEQFAGYFKRHDADIQALRDPQRTRSMQAILGIEGANENQVLKQPDVLMLMFLLDELYSPEQIRVNWDYYNPRTDHEHGSSLGPSITAIMACRMGEPDEAYEHFMRAARADLQDVRHNAGDGIHAASAGGLWQAAVLGFAGLRLSDTGCQTKPQLPSHWRRLAFSVYCRGKRQHFDIRSPGVDGS